MDPIAHPLKRLLTEEEVCRLLRVSREAILKFKRDLLDPVPHMKVGRRYLYDQDKVFRWAERQAKRALGESGGIQRQ